LMGLAWQWTVLALGRFIVGVSSGIAVCLVPPFLSLLARSAPELASRSGFIGTMNQLGIVFGLFSAQVGGLILTGPKGDIPGNWRYVVGISGIVSLIQIAIASRIPDPTAAMNAVSPADPEAAATLDAPSAAERDESSPLLPETATGVGSSSSEAQLPLRELLSNTSLRGPTLLCAAIMCLQQFSGVNAVMFYSTPVLKPLLPTSAGALGIGITLVNAIMTLPAIFLVDRLGRRTLMLYSIAGMAVMSALLAFGLDDHHQYLSGFAIISFIASFSIGLGPVPFLLVSELAPPPAIPALSSLSLSCNWIAAFCVAISFLPLRDALSSPIDPRDPLSDRKGEGRVFYVFTIVCLGTGLLVWRGLGRSKS